MNHPVDDVLQRYFHDVARDDRLGDTPVRLVMRRGRRRRARRRTSAMAGTLVAGALGSVVAVRTLSGTDDGRRQVSVGNGESDGSSGPAPSPVPTVGDIQLAPSPLVWNEVTIGSAEALAGLGPTVADPTGGFYALSSQPGRSTDPTPALYQSEDGLHWQVRGAPPTLTRSQLDAANGRLYAVGTAAATVPLTSAFDGRPVLAESSDGGQTWSEVDLPIEMESTRTVAGITGARLDADVAAGPGGLLVAALETASLDIDRYLPDGVSREALDWFPWAGIAVRYDVTTASCADMAAASAATAPAGSSTETTISFGSFDGVTCFRRGVAQQRYTFDELGIAPETQALLRGSVHVLLAPDGSSFSEVASLPAPDGWSVGSAEVVASADEYVVLVTLNQSSGDPVDGVVRNKVLVYTSPDGISWSIDEIPDVQGGEAAYLADGTLAVSGWSSNGPSVAVRRDGSWTTTTLAGLEIAGAPLASTPTTTAIGRAGIALVGYVGDPIASDPPATTPFAETAYPIPGGGMLDPGSVRPVLVYSPDGVSWSAQTLDEIGDGDPAFRPVGSVVVTDQSVLIGTTAQQPADDPNVPLPDQRVLVGTRA